MNNKSRYINTSNEVSSEYNGTVYIKEGLIIFGHISQPLQQQNHH